MSTSPPSSSSLKNSSPPLSVQSVVATTAATMATATATPPTVPPSIRTRTTSANAAAPTLTTTSGGGGVSPIPTEGNNRSNSGTPPPLSPIGMTVSAVPLHPVPLPVFKFRDEHPRRQRHQLVRLRELHQALAERGELPPGHKERRDVASAAAGRMRTKDLDLPFKRVSTFAISKLNPLAAKPKYKYSPEVTLHRLLLAVRDRRDDAAETLLHDVTQPMTKKKYPFEANTIFLTALANRMEKVACMLLDRGFPPDVNAPVYTMKPTKKYAEFMPFRMNTALFPSYFLVAVAMNFEMLVKFMIKLGANLNQDWFGLTPLHVALYCLDGQPNMNILRVLLEYGADPAVPMHIEQLHHLYKLQKAFGMQGTVDALGDSKGSGGSGGAAATSGSNTGATTSTSGTPFMGKRLSTTDIISAVTARRRFKSESAKVIPQEALRAMDFGDGSNIFTAFPLSSLPQRNLYRTAPTGLELMFKQPMTTVTEGVATGAPTMDEVRRPSAISRTAMNRLSTPTIDSMDTSATSEWTVAWRKHCYVLPIAFATASGNRDAVVAILQRWHIGKARRSFVASISASTPTLLKTPFASSLNTSGNSSGTADKSLTRLDNLTLLIQQDLETTIHLLKSGGINIHQRNPRGANALHLAVRTGNIDMCHLLLHFDDVDGSLLQSKGENGWTALHEAISLKRLEIFRLLLKKSARTDVANDRGDTPRELGARAGIDPSDLDGVWFGSLGHAMTTGMRDSSATVLAGGRSNELLFNLDAKLLKLLSAPDAQSNTMSFGRRTGNAIASVRTLPFGRSVTLEEDRPSASMDNIADMSGSTDSDIGQSQAVPAVKSSRPTSGSIVSGFRRMFVGGGSSSSSSSNASKGIVAKRRESDNMGGAGATRVSHVQPSAGAASNDSSKSSVSVVVTSPSPEAKSP